MIIRMKASEATLELGLAKLKRQREAAPQWLKRLGAESVEFGEPHFADQADMDPMMKMRAETVKTQRKLQGKPTTDERNRDVVMVLTARWNIALMSAEEALVLLDRLRFEANEDVAPPEPVEEPKTWDSPQEQIQHMMAQMQRMHEMPQDDPAPIFLFISRLDDNQVKAAMAVAFSNARANAESVAGTAGMRIVALASIFNHAGHLVSDAKADKMLDRRGLLSKLAGSAYDLTENEIVSEDARTVEFAVKLQVTFYVDALVRAITEAPT